MASVGWGPVLLFVQPFEACRRFYEDGIGLVPRVARAGYVEYPVGSATLALHATSEPRPGPGPVALHLYVESADAMAQQLLAAGFPPLGPVVAMPWGRELSVADPAGCPWDLLERPA